jgi:hypothetical protein
MSFTMIPRYSKEEFARRGNEIYDRDILPKLKPEDNGKLIAIDIETGDYELDRDLLMASDRLAVRHPDAQIWVRRVGSSYVYRFGGYRRTSVAQPS